MNLNEENQRETKFLLSLYPSDHIQGWSRHHDTTKPDQPETISKHYEKFCEMCYFYELW